MKTVSIPPRSVAHCGDDAAWAEFVRQYDGQPRSMPAMSDFALANAVFLVDRNSLDLMVLQTAAKERIRWLSIELAKARAALSQPVAWEREGSNGWVTVAPEDLDHYRGKGQRIRALGVIQEGQA